MRTLLLIVFTFFSYALQAQVFINKGMIEYQVVTNNHKALGEGTWAEMIRDKIPKLSTSFYQLTFDADKSIPGMIMGITIPRMFSSWVATKLEINGVNYTKIIAPTKGKKKKAKELQQTVVQATKDWGSWGQQAVWKIFL
ncbi:MAG: hypothetical protein IPP96_12690 [Chitinophagaceae bacterium]|nr:hypothetical protein [Chitinophagaceae bacterium]